MIILKPGLCYICIYLHRLPLPKHWGGARNEELDSIPGCVFVHTNRHFGINKTREGVIQMANVALEYAEKSEANIIF